MRNTPRRSRVALAAAGALVATAALAGCSGSDENTIQVYSARHYDLEEAFEKFADETGVDVEFLFGADAELRERLAAEGADSPADVYITVDAGNLAAGAEQGIFEPLESEVLDEAIPDNLKDEQNRWFGLAKRVRTIIYNPEKADASDLSTYEALAEPEWKDRVCLRTANASYTQSLVASMIADRGEGDTRQVLQGWADNAEIFSNDVEIINNVDSGKCDVAIVNHYYLARELRERPDLNVKVFWANQDAGGVHVNISGAGVVAGADNVDGAKKLIEWLATDGQTEFVGDNMEYPANPTVEPSETLQEFGEFTEQPINASAYAELNADAVALMGEAGYK